MKWQLRFVVVQVLNRDKLQRAGEDNLFVRLLYAKDKAQTPKNQDEQEKLGMPHDPHLFPFQPLPYNPVHLPATRTSLTVVNYHVVCLELGITVKRLSMQHDCCCSGCISHVLC